MSRPVVTFAMSALVLGGVLLASSVAVPGLPAAIDRLRAHWQGTWLTPGVVQPLSNRALAAALAAVATVAVWVAGPLGIGAVLTALWLGPRGVAWWHARQSERRFAQQLPDALAAIAASLKAGQSLPQAMVGVAERFPAPVRHVFAAATRDVQAGSDVAAALRSAGAGVGTHEWWLFVTSVEVLYRVGGRLTVVIERVSDTLRRRQQIAARLRTLTAQSRMQAWVMGALPPTFVALLPSLDADLARALVRTPAGWTALAFATTCEVVAVVLMRRIVRAVT